MWKFYEIHILVSINKVLFEHSNTHSFTCYLWLPLVLQPQSWVAVTLIVCPAGPKIFTLWPLQKNLLVTGLEGYPHSIPRVCRWVEIPMWSLLLPDFLIYKLLTHSFSQYVFIESPMPGTILGTGPQEWTGQRRSLPVWSWHPSRRRQTISR